MAHARSLAVLILITLAWQAPGQDKKDRLAPDLHLYATPVVKDLFDPVFRDVVAKERTVPMATFRGKVVLLSFVVPNC